MAPIVCSAPFTPDFLTQFCIYHTQNPALCLGRGETQASVKRAVLSVGVRSSRRHSGLKTLPGFAVSPEAASSCGFSVNSFYKAVASGHVRLWFLGHSMLRPASGSSHALPCTCSDQASLSPSPGEGSVPGHLSPHSAMHWFLRALGLKLWNLL